MPFDPAQQTPDVPPLPGVGEAFHDAAQAWARRGFKVFPLRPGGKVPVHEGWQQSATTDVATIKSMWSTRDWIDPATGEVIERFHPYNIGYVTDDLVVVDLDKKFDPNVDDVYRNQMLGDFDTLEVRTTSGGTHLIYRNPARDRATRTKIGGFSIDIKAVGGLAVAPGSRFAGAEYVLAEDRPIKLIPAHLLDWLPAARAKRNKSADVPLVNLDKPGAVAAAIRLAKGWKPGVAGSRGSDCYKLASLLRDRGIGEATAKAIIFEHWAPRCVDSQGNPAPFPLENEGGVQGVDETVAHAFEYAQNPPGAKAPERMLDSLDAEALERYGDSAAQGPPNLPPPPPGGDPLPGGVTSSRLVMLTEDGIAGAFFSQYGSVFRRVSDTDLKLIWDGRRWLEDKTNRDLALMREVARDATYALAAARPKDVTKSDANRMARAATAKGALTFFYSEPSVNIGSEILDADDFLIGVPDGPVDLHTAVTRPANPSDYITMSTAVSPAATDHCPLFKDVLSHGLEGDQETIAFLQRYFGSCLTGDTSDQQFVFMYGKHGGEGKGVIARTVTGILGDYAKNAAAETFLASRTQQHLTELEFLRGARAVIVPEIPKGATWNEGRIKLVTGGDKVTSRAMRANMGQWNSKMKLLIAGNNLPQFQSADDAMRRRFHLVEFKQRPAEVDTHLEQRMRAEWPAIFRWLLDGCLAWQRIGLAPPRSVIEATNAYFAAHDSFGLWAAECAVQDPDGRERFESLRASYNRWARRAGEREVSIPVFKESWTDRQTLLQRITIDGYPYLKGIRLRARDGMPIAGIA